MKMTNVTAVWEGLPLQTLQELVRKRVSTMHEDAGDAVIATAIDVVKSLRTLTKKSPVKAKKAMFRIEKTPYIGSWERSGGHAHRVARIRGTGAKAPVFPVNNAGDRYVPGERVWVYKVTPVHGERWNWSKNKNDGAWYVFACSVGVARKFAIEHVSRALRKESGLAKTALGFAMAHLSTRKEPTVVKNARMVQIASEAARVAVKMDKSGFSVEILDDLEYSKGALKGGDRAISLAMARAANKIAGRLAKYEETHFLERTTKTPFPEIVQRRTKK